MQTLDELLGTEEPHASFHDASLLELPLDYRGRTASVLFDLYIGDPNATDEVERERTRAGLLELKGLIFWVQEPPDPGERAGCPWLASDGPLQDWPTETARTLAGQVPSEAWAWGLYFSDWNAPAYCAARNVVFRWVG